MRVMLGVLEEVFVMLELLPFGRVLSVRPEVSRDSGLVDMVDLAAVTEVGGGGPGRGLRGRAPGGATIQDPSAFFDITYPSADVRETLFGLARRGARPEEEPGTILLAGNYGAGKSHVLLAAHHALSAPAVARRWAERWGLEEMALPEGARVVTRSLIHRTTSALWEVLFEGLGRPELAETIETYPDGAFISGLLDERPLVLVLDELERWFASLLKEQVARNLAFIQALCEVAHRDGRLTLVTSVLDEAREPARTIRRTRPKELTFLSADDRQQVLLFRLFSDRDTLDPAALEPVVQAYIGTYREAGLPRLDELAERMRQTYPFSPELLDILTKKVPQLGGFQNTRGTLRFVARLTRANYQSRPLVTSQNLPIRDAGIVTALRGLDRASGGEVVRRALGDNLEAAPRDLPHREELFSTLVFYSVADPSHPGATLDEVLFAALDPGENRNMLLDALTQLRKVAYNLHVRDDRHVFLTQENPEARVNALADSQQVAHSAQRSVIHETLLQRWGDAARTAIYTGEADRDAVAEDLRRARGKRPLFVLCTVALDPQKRLTLQNLHDQRNLVLLLEPRVQVSGEGGAYDLHGDPEIIGPARRIQACNLLLEARPGAEARLQYEEIRRRNLSTLGKRLDQRYGLAVIWLRAGSDTGPVDESWYELPEVETLSAAKFVEQLQRDYTNPTVIKEAVARRWRDYLHRPVADLVAQFEREPGLPMPLEERWVAGAVVELASDGTLGVTDEKGRTFCRGNVGELAAGALGRSTLVPAPEVVTPAPPAKLPQHEAVELLFDEEPPRVRLKWRYPEPPAGERYRTLIQRYTASKGWEQGKEVPIDLDISHDANRYLGADEAMEDAEGFSPGSWYHYYIFLVVERPGAPPRAVLSGRRDVQVPAPQTGPQESLVQIQAQLGWNKLFSAVERKVMTPKVMGGGRLTREVKFQIRHITRHKPLLELAAGLDVPDEALSVSGDVTITVHQDLDRQKLLKLVRALPRLEGAQYSATIELRDSPEEGK